MIPKWHRWLESIRAKPLGWVGFALAFMIGWIPGFAGPGYESALLLGILLPTPVAVVSAFSVHRGRLLPILALEERFLEAARCAFGVLLALTLHGLRVSFCNTYDGFVVVLLGPTFGLFMASAWGSAVGLARPLATRGRLIAFSLLGPLGSIGISLGRFYSSPMIFAYDPFVGYFSGALYDTILSFDGLVTYRAGSLMTLLTTALAVSHLDGKRHFRWKGRPFVVGMGCITANLSVVHLAAGPQLGHFHTARTIADALGEELDGHRCRLIYDRSISRDDATRLLGECEAHIVQNERWWGERGPDKITAFVFESDAQKGRLMGAAGTNIAKPWRSEVYIQIGGFPHRVIGHELMHVIARGRGPFKVAGAAFGLLPNPGLIEGVAVAAAPREDELSAREWAQAMRQLELLPRLDSLFGLSFFSSNASMAYTVSGAFVEWFHERYGAAALRGWYGGASLQSLTGRSLDELESDWLSELDEVPLPEGALSLARSKFDRPGFFARQCPRTVDSCRRDADSRLSNGDTTGAMTALRTALQYEPDNPNLKLDWARAEWLHQERGSSEAYADRLLALETDPSLPGYAQDRAVEARADLLLSEGQGSKAEPLYAELIARTLDENRIRTLEVKRHATKNATLRPAIVDLLVGRPRERPDRTSALMALAVHDEAFGQDGLAAYLIARYYMDDGRYADATSALDRALARELDTPKVRTEALRLRVQASVALGKCEQAEPFLAAYSERVRPARADFASRMVDRCFTVKDLTGNRTSVQTP